MKLSKIAACVLLASAGTVFSSAALADAPGLTAAPVLTKLANPWDMAILPDGTMFFTEKCNGLSVRQASGTVVKLLGMKDSKGYDSTASDLFCDGQAGMSGVAVDPDFAKNRYIYVYSASNMTAPGTNRVMRLIVSADGTKVSDRKDIVTDIQYKPKASDHPFGGPGAHNGGRVRFSPGDGFPYVTTGDTHNGEVPQSRPRLAAKFYVSIATVKLHRTTMHQQYSIPASLLTSTVIHKVLHRVRAPISHSPLKTAHGTRMK